MLHIAPLRLSVTSLLEEEIRNHFADSNHFVWFTSKPLTMQFVHFCPLSSNALQYVRTLVKVLNSSGVFMSTMHVIIWVFVSASVKVNQHVSPWLPSDSGELKRKKGINITKEFELVDELDHHDLTHTSDLTIFKYFCYGHRELLNHFYLLILCKTTNNGLSFTQRELKLDCLDDYW